MLTVQNRTEVHDYQTMTYNAKEKLISSHSILSFGNKKY